MAAIKGSRALAGNCLMDVTSRCVDVPDFSCKIESIVPVRSYSPTFILTLSCTLGNRAVSNSHF